MKSKYVIIGAVILVVVIGIFIILYIKEKIEQPAEMLPVKIDGTDFVRDNETFKFIGANIMSLVWYDESGLSVDKAIKTAKESGIDVLRIYLPGNRFEGPFSGPYTEWPKEGEEEDIATRSHIKDYIGNYNEHYFKQLDAILDTASKREVYIIITLKDYVWTDDIYWMGGEREGIFTDPELIEAFKNFVTYTLTRKNTINGKIYKDDTTILAWDIINEPQTQYSPDMALPDWLKIITTHIHSLDTNHPVTVGLTTNDPMWDEYMSFYEIVNDTGIDFFSFHIYPEQWANNGSLLPYTIEQPYGNPNPNPDVTKKLISFRTKSFLSFGKPVVMEEFGFPTKHGQTELLKVYRDSMDAAFESGASGAVFWHWGIPQAKKRFDSWGLDDHTYTEKEFVAMLKEYVDKF